MTLTPLNAGRIFPRIGLLVAAALFLPVFAGAPPADADAALDLPMPELVAFFPFAEDLEGWNGHGDGTVSLATDPWSRGHHLHAVADARDVYEVGSPPVAMSNESVITFFFRMDDGSATTDVLHLRTADDDVVLALRVRANSFEYTDGTTSAGDTIWRRAATGIHTMWHRVDVDLDGAFADVTIDQLETERVETLTEDAPRVLVVPPGPRGVHLDGVRVTTAPLQVDHDLTTPPEMRGLDLVLVGDAATAESGTGFLGHESRGSLRLTSDSLPGTLAYVGFSAEDLSSRMLLTAAVKTRTLWPVTFDHPAALAGLDENGEVVWAVTHAHAIPQGFDILGFWFWDAEGGRHLLNAPSGQYQWRPIWVLQDAGTGTIDVYVDERHAGHFDGIPHYEVVRVASGDVWSGLLPTGRVNGHVDNVAAVAVPPGWTPDGRPLEGASS